MRKISLTEWRSGEGALCKIFDAQLRQTQLDEARWLSYWMKVVERNYWLNGSESISVTQGDGALLKAWSSMTELLNEGCRNIIDWMVQSISVTQGDRALLKAWPVWQSACWAWHFNLVGTNCAPQLFIVCYELNMNWFTLEYMLENIVKTYGLLDSQPIEPDTLT